MARSQLRALPHQALPGRDRCVGAPRVRRLSQALRRGRFCVAGGQVRHRLAGSRHAVRRHKLERGLADRVRLPTDREALEARHSPGQGRDGVRRSPGGHRHLAARIGFRRGDPADDRPVADVLHRRVPPHRRRRETPATPVAGVGRLGRVLRRANPVHAARCVGSCRADISAGSVAGNRRGGVSSYRRVAARRDDLHTGRPDEHRGCHRFAQRPLCVAIAKCEGPHPAFRRGRQVRQVECRAAAIAG